MTQQTFADFIGISSASLSSIFNGRTKPTLKYCWSYKKEKFPKISLDWLMYGTEPMFNDEATEAKNESNMDALPTNLNLFNDIPPAPSVSSINESQNSRNVSPQTKDIIKTEVKYIDKPQRNITEIRIFFDDQTWETFVPKKWFSALKINISFSLSITAFYSLAPFDILNHRGALFFFIQCLYPINSLTKSFSIFRISIFYSYL